MNKSCNLQYLSSTGEEFLLQQARLVKVKTANFHAYEWIPMEFGVSYGSKVLYFRKEPILYEMSLFLRGSVTDRIDFLQAFHNAIDTDVYNNKAGRLYWGDVYIECFIHSSSTYPYEGGYATVNDCIVYAPYPSWIYEKTYARPVFSVDDVVNLMGVEEESVTITSGDFFAPFPALPSRWKVGIIGAATAYVKVVTPNGRSKEIYVYADTASGFLELTSSQKLLLDGVDNVATLYGSTTEDYTSSTAGFNDKIHFEKDITKEGIGISLQTESGDAMNRAILTAFFERSEPVWI